MAEVGRKLASVEIATLQSPDRGIGEVVPHHPDHRQIVFDRGAEHARVHEKGAVAADRDAGTLGGRELCAEHTGDAESHRAETHRTNERIRPARMAKLNEPIVVNADVAHQDGVFGQDLVDLVRGALRVDRRGIIGEARGDECVPLAAVSIDGGEPFRARGRSIADAVTGIDLRQHLLEKGAHVGHQPERHWIIAGDLVGIDVDVDELGRWNGERIAGKPRARRAVVEAHAERKQDIGGARRVIGLIGAVACDKP